jgi:hypothetical protein
VSIDSSYHPIHMGLLRWGCNEKANRWLKMPFVGADLSEKISLEQGRLISNETNLIPTLSHHIYNIGHPDHHRHHKQDRSF